MAKKDPNARWMELKNRHDELTGKSRTLIEEQERDKIWAEMQKLRKGVGEPQNFRGRVAGRVQEAWNHPKGKAFGTLGLMGGATLATLKGGHGAIKATGRAVSGQFRAMSAWILIFPFIIIFSGACSIPGHC